MAETSSCQDIFLGVVKILPSFVDQKVQDEWHPLVGGTGHIRVQMCYKLPTKHVPLTIEAFDLLKVIGKGSFGKVQYFAFNCAGDASA